MPYAGTILRPIMGHRGGDRNPEIACSANGRELARVIEASGRPREASRRHPCDSKGGLAGGRLRYRGDFRGARIMATSPLPRGHS